MSHRRFDAQPLNKLERTPQGGYRIQANLTRTGIFEYRQPDGSVRKEYRPPEEVFKQNHLDSFRDAPVTIGHPGVLTASTWGEHSTGHVSGTPAQDGAFVRGTLVIQRADAVAKLERGELKELSLGYDVDLDETPGEVDGQRYDAVQRNIVGNHVAMGPAGWGRGGKDVAMRLDSKLDELTDYTKNSMATENTPDPQLAVQKARIDTLEAQNQGLQAKVDTLTEQLVQANDPSRFDSAIEVRLGLIESAKAADPKFDAAGKSNREIKESVIKARAPKMKFDSKSSDDFVNAAYEMALTFEAPTAQPHASLGKVRADANEASVVVDSISKAHDQNSNSSLNAWKQPLRTVNQ